MGPATSNRAVGGNRNTAGTFLGAAWGGGLYGNGANSLGSSGGSTTTIRNSVIADNEAVGGRGADGGPGGDARGDGIANLYGAVVTVSGSTVAEGSGKAWCSEPLRLGADLP